MKIEKIENMLKLYKFVDFLRKIIYNVSIKIRAVKEDNCYG